MQQIFHNHNTFLDVVESSYSGWPMGWASTDWFKKFNQSPTRDFKLRSNWSNREWMAALKFQLITYNHYDRRQEKLTAKTRRKSDCRNAALKERKPKPSKKKNKFKNKQETV